MKRFVVWGGKTGMDSFRHIMRAYYETARKIGINTVWFDDQPGNKLETGDVVLCVDVYQRHLVLRKNVDYVMHNFYPDHSVMEKADPDRILRLQVWTTDAYGEKWDDYRQFSAEHRILFQPWGTDLLAEEFLEPVFNPQSREVVFVGAVWSDLSQGYELGNTNEINALKEVCSSNNLTLKLLTQLPDSQMVDVTRKARLAPTVVGRWQCDHGYLPCRAFKHASYGVPVFTNSVHVAELFETVAAPSVENLVWGMLRCKQKDYLELAHGHQKIAARYTYRESIQAIQRAIEEGRGQTATPFSTGEKISL